MHLRFTHVVVLSVARSILLLSSIPSCGYAVCLSTHQLVDIWIVFQFMVIMKETLITFMYTFLWKRKFAFFFLNKYLGVGPAASYGKYMFNFKKMAKLISKVAVPFPVFSSVSCVTALQY